MRQVELRVAHHDIHVRAWIADRWWERARGVLGRPPLPPGQGLLLSPCSSVHGIGMTRSLDLAFLDAGGTILRLAPLRPMGLAWHRQATQVLELACGEIQRLGLQCGHRLCAQP